MKTKIKDILSVWKDVFSSWKYVILIAFIALFFYSINVFIANFSSIISLYSRLGFLGILKFFLILFLGFWETRPLSSFFSLIIISVLFGVLFSLITFKTKMIKSASGKTMGVLGTTGVFIGILAPGCAACGVGLLSLFGVSAALLGSLPFGGLELSFLAIGILGFSVIKISKDIKKGIVCKI